MHSAGARLLLHAALPQVQVLQDESPWRKVQFLTQCGTELGRGNDRQHRLHRHCPKQVFRGALLEGLLRVQRDRRTVHWRDVQVSAG